MLSAKCELIPFSYTLISPERIPFDIETFEIKGFSYGEWQNHRDSIFPLLTIPPHPMDFSYKNSIITISSDKKEIVLSSESVVLDGLAIELPGEYEKSSILMYSFHKNDERLYHFRTEGYWIAYIPEILTDISTEALDFLGGIDILIMPGAKSMQSTLEKVEPGLLITYGESAHEIALALWSVGEIVSKYKMKEADLSTEKTTCVVMG